MTRLEKQIIWTIAIVLFLLVVEFVKCSRSHGQDIGAVTAGAVSTIRPAEKADKLDKTRFVESIIGESENQGPLGMHFVACAIRNRGTFDGVNGWRSKRVKQHLYPAYVFVNAVRAYEESADSSKCKIVRGADSWQSDEDLKEKPHAMDGCKKLFKLNGHTFFNCGVRKEKNNYEARY
jgi:hypothetical protein